ncbi:MAG: leucyl aminopeptidase family protein [Alphaproteobacteria bacterium]
MAFSKDSASAAIPIEHVEAGTEIQDAKTRTWVESNGGAVENSVHIIPDDDGSVKSILFITGTEPTIWDFAALPEKLPQGTYTLAKSFEPEQATLACLVWGLGGYVFDRYKESKRKYPALVMPDCVDEQMIRRQVTGINLTRDLINTPANDMGPSHLADAASDLAKQHKAKCKIITGESLEKEFPAIHAVGRAAADEPRLIDLKWGDTKHPKVTLVGKGVCFDTGGLDLKPSAFMLTMKKDMGGAANVLGLAHMIMDAKLPINLRVLIPAVENSVAGNAYRPMDIIRSRKGLTIEIGNTDAEGRVVLADALDLACEDNPDLIIDMATLTGAARVALGTELPALFSNNDEIAHEAIAFSHQEQDSMWHMPLWQPYRALINSPNADIKNNPSTGMGGAISAALFLESFLEKDIPWIHIDVMAWNTSSKPGRPEGGEAMGIRGLFRMLEKKYS